MFSPHQFIFFLFLCFYFSVAGSEEGEADDDDDVIEVSPGKNDNIRQWHCSIWSRIERSISQNRTLFRNHRFGEIEPHKMWKRTIFEQIRSLIRVHISQ